MNNMQDMFFHKDKFPLMELPKGYKEVWRDVLRKIIDLIPNRRHIGNVISHRLLEWVQGKNTDKLIYKMELGMQIYILKNSKLYQTIGTYASNPTITTVSTRVCILDGGGLFLKQESSNILKVTIVVCNLK